MTILVFIQNVLYTGLFIAWKVKSMRSERPPKWTYYRCRFTNLDPISIKFGLYNVVDKTTCINFNPYICQLPLKLD